jgi:hypothetical protein
MLTRPPMVPLLNHVGEVSANRNAIQTFFCRFLSPSPRPRSPEGGDEGRKKRQKKELVRVDSTEEPANQGESFVFVGPGASVSPDSPVPRSCPFVELLVPRVCIGNLAPIWVNEYQGIVERVGIPIPARMKATPGSIPDTASSVVLFLSKIRCRNSYIRAS